MPKTIPQLTDATTVGAADELVIQQGGITKRATISELKTQVANFESNNISTSGTVDASTAELSDTGWDKTADPVFGRSTPQNALLALGGHYNQTGGASVNYKWGVSSWLTNGNTAPLTNIDAVAQGWKCRAGGFAARQTGADGDGHAVEILSGQWASKANVATTSGSTDLTVNSVTFKGSRFCAGDPISGTNIPAAATIVSVSKGATTYSGNSAETISVVSGGSGYVAGDVVTLSGGTSTVAATATVQAVSGGAITRLLVLEQGNYSVNPAGTLNLTGGSGSGATATVTMIKSGLADPTTITISAAATGTSSSVDATVLSSVDNMNIGLLITGSGDGGTTGDGNENGRAIQIQSYNDAAFLNGIVFAGSSLRTDGKGILFSSGAADRGISFESFSLAQALRVSGGNFTNLLLATSTTCSGSAISFSSVTATNGINFSSSNSFSGAAINLDGQNIATTSTNGMKIGTNSTQKIGFWNATPVARPAAIADATDAASTQARLNDLLAALRTIGLIAT